MLFKCYSNVIQMYQRDIHNSAKSQPKLAFIIMGKKFQLNFWVRSKHRPPE